ncbi:ATP synthase F1 subunit gamma [Thermosediminibacter oceani]|uniref:ATP synthase gamma chain n=1 Tax=Thermosediminibacter oceani (strain ATCC BAA-1034 / DSM 16646 / JW/IW-1228P) TaxID=555079 RepID=D9RZW4_THEOJ|nr:ATP synthase F1 subunit gamma [Thermosediminibacter oceani]ADL08741.1 ATP synthase F1, gamma subunit [Thermosediminibacter oceani DSM 16646]
MAGLREIRRRLGSIKNMRKITQAFHLISSARLKTVQKKLEDYGALYESMKEIVARIPVEEKDGKGKPLLIVMAGDRGLAGGYNAAVLQEAEKTLRKFKEPVLVTVGRKAGDFFSKQGLKPAVRLVDVAKNLSPGCFDGVIGLALDHYRQGGSVFVTYTRFKNPFSMKPVTERLLPSEKAEDKNIDFAFEPAPRELMDYVAGLYLKLSLYGLYLHSYASELASRMRATETATENADDLIEKLTLQFHRERKAVITREITEIVSGAENYQH